ncbi:hypothetical protein [Novosphingobium album (ex Liu et al. 2023)]|uniref:Uncharacterized protein n=1 Tax=Novosphingobium album (ex Liu et al. 2023) TaxID=3031130 RepID=A0ABT5WT48_9SPHN|nr:hypothetical protein [Novosphingobium album (ex Liu et al. 2023)]MDE8653114.1 hypothetical protein [Novosphingobium album (ex Liu et al. 2023)]
MAQGSNRPVNPNEADRFVASGLYGFALYGLAMCNCNEGVVRLLDAAQARPRQGGSPHPQAGPAA